MEGLTTIASYSGEVANMLGKQIRELGPRLIAREATLDLGPFFAIFPDEHRRFLERLVMFKRTADVVCVHGGLGSLSPEAEAPHTLVWGPASFPQSYEGEELVVYSHHADPVLEMGRPSPRILPTVHGGVSFGIDTIAHGALTAMRFPDRCVFQSPRSA